MTPPNPAAQALEPCAHCGGKASRKNGAHPGYHSIGCKDCKVSTALYADKQEAIAAWNRRTPPPAPSADWITAPRVPTEAMLLKGYSAYSLGAPDAVTLWQNIWSAMLSAAPPPPAPDEAVVERVAMAIYDAVEPLSGDQIGAVLHMSDHLFWEQEPGDKPIEQQLNAVRSICRVAARAALAALPHPIAGEKGE